MVLFTMLKTLFDIKSVAYLMTLAVGLGANYMAVTSKIENLEKNAPNHVNRNEFALQQALIELKIQSNKDDIKKIDDQIERIYERYGWEKK